MSGTDLGVVPQAFNLHLTKGGDFVCTLESDDGDWPLDLDITIEVGSDVWHASLSGPDALFNEDPATVTAVIDESPDSFQLWATDTNDRLLWGDGPVKIHGG